MTGPDNNELLPELEDDELIIDVDTDEPLTPPPDAISSAPSLDDDGIITSAASSPGLRAIRPRKAPAPAPGPSLAQARDPSRDPTLLGRYKILDILGRGAFSIVYRASQVGIGRVVALKVFLLPPATRHNSQAAEAALARFQREGRLAAGLRHPHTVTLYDYDKTDQGILYMAFEYVEGPTISRELKSKPGGMPISRAVHITRQVAQSLEEAHQQGIIHRDLKPGNIMLTRRQNQDDYVKVLDFGIAKLVGSTDTEQHADFDMNRSNMMEVINLIEPQPIAGDDLTANGRIVGTPRYIPPEQIHGQTLGPSADIYALGLILHEMVCGTPANPGKQARDLLTWHLEDLPFNTPAGFVCPPGLAHVIQKATRKMPQERYQSCQELLDDLDKLDDEGNWLKAPSKTPTVALVVGVNVALVLVLAAVGYMVLGGNQNAPENATQAAAVAAQNNPVKDTKAAPEPNKAPQNKAAPDKDKPPAAASAATKEGEPGQDDAEAPKNEPKPAELRQVEISSYPTGADVYIGDLKVGVTPLPMTLEEDQETLTITLKKRGYRSKNITWTADMVEPAFPARLRMAPSNTNNKRPGGNGGTKKGGGYHIVE